jgi:hypothetical protein
MRRHAPGCHRCLEIRQGRFLEGKWRDRNTIIACLPDTALANRKRFSDERLPAQRESATSYCTESHKMSTIHDDPSRKSL